MKHFILQAVFLIFISIVISIGLLLLCKYPTTVEKIEKSNRQNSLQREGNNEGNYEGNNIEGAEVGDVDATQVVLGKVYWESDLSWAKRKKEVTLITDLFKKLIRIVKNKNLKKLPNHVSKERGLYVDLKAHWSYRRLLKEIASGRGYLYSNLLKNDSDLSVRSVLQLTKQIRIDLYIEKDELQKDSLQCELKLHLVDMLDKSYYLNNPVFIKEKGRWYIYRLL